MLTQHDITISNALEVLEEVKNTGLRCIGCKNIGLDLVQYRELFKRIKTYGMKSFLEVVSNNEAEHFKGVDLALNMGADYIIGGMPQFTSKTLKYLKARGSELKYFPYIGNVVDHPCILRGSITEIIEDGIEAKKLSVNGVNLLLYRYQGDQKKLLKEFTEKLELPMIVAGNIREFEQIEELKNKKVWAFTIGGAILEKNFIKEKGIKEQITAVLKKI
jgi:indole-3-glycerol phosphate synthase